MLLKYQPVRIIQKFSVVAKTLDKMKELFPNAIIESSVPVVAGYYKPGSVIDSPSEEEHGLFEKLPDYLAIYIPQVDGFDDPNSGLARSRKACWRGKQKWMRSMDGAKFEVPLKKIEVKPVVDAPEIIPVIEEIKEPEHKESKSDDAEKPSQRKRRKEKHVISDINDEDNFDLNINNEVIKSDE